MYIKGVSLFWLEFKFRSFEYYLFILNCNWVDTWWQQYSTHLVDTRWQQYSTYLVDTRWQQYSTHLHTDSTQNTENGIYTTIKQQQQQNGKCGPCSDFASYILAFALQMRKKHRKNSEHGNQIENLIIESHLTVNSVSLPPVYTLYLPRVHVHLVSFSLCHIYPSLSQVSSVATFHICFKRNIAHNICM
jgi:hypothetical protein